MTASGREDKMAESESSGNTHVEKEVLQVLRESSTPQASNTIVTSIDTESPSSVREAIRSLVNSGDLQVTLDWKIRLRERA